MKKVEFIVLEYHEFDTLVNTNLKPKVQYECVADEEWHNDTAHTVYLADLADVDPYGKEEEKDIQKFIKGKTPNYVGPYQLIGALVNRGVLPMANYLIVVSW